MSRSTSGTQNMSYDLLRESISTAMLTRTSAKMAGIVSQSQRATAVPAAAVAGAAKVDKAPKARVERTAKVLEKSIVSMWGFQ